MSKDTEGDHTSNQSPQDSVEMVTISDPYKVLGDFADSNGGIGVLGRNTAGSGPTKGVEGRVDSPDGYGLSTPNDANIGGTAELSTIDTTGSDFTVGAGGTGTGDATNVVVGHSFNSVASGVVGGTISGGGYADGSIARPNHVSGNYGTIGGGRENTSGGFSATVGGGNRNKASAWEAFVGGGSGNTASGQNSTVGGGDGNSATANDATIGGGTSNTASGSQSTVGGGQQNTANGSNATIPGGRENIVDGHQAFAAGWRSKTENSYSFVWNDGSYYHDTTSDGSEDGLSSGMDIAGSGVTGDNTFHASAVGGFRFITGSNSVTYISGGSTGWSTTSTRAAKTNIDPVDPEEVLDGVTDMDVATWEYKAEDGGGQGVRHMGPMAEDFHDVFDLGASDTGINSINADGVAIAAIQGLCERLAEKAERIEELEDRLAALEAHVGTADPAPADD